MPAELFDCNGGRSLGTLTDGQLQALIDALEEESLTDRDYHVSRDTIDMLEADGADAALVGLLRAGLGTREEFDVRWEKR